MEHSVFICNERINVYGDLVLNPLETIHVPYFHFNISRVVSINLLTAFIESKKSLTRNWYRSLYRVVWERVREREREELSYERVREWEVQRINWEIKHISTFHVLKISKIRYITNQVYFSCFQHIMYQIYIYIMYLYFLNSHSDLTIPMGMK